MPNGNIKTQIRRFIAENLLYSDSGFEYSDDVSLLAEGIIDSMGVMELIPFLEEIFEVTVGDHEITPDNFDSVEKLANYVSRKRKATRQ